MEELMKICKRLNLTANDLALEADCVMECGQWIHLDLQGYSPAILRKAAKRLMEVKE